MYKSAVYKSVFKSAAIIMLSWPSGALAYWPRVTTASTPPPSVAATQQAATPAAAPQSEQAVGSPLIALLRAGGTVEALNAAGQVIGQVSASGQLVLLSGQQASAIASVQVVSASGETTRFALLERQDRSLTFAWTAAGEHTTLSLSE